MSKVIGHAACPECSETQEVLFDTKKYYIKCASCHTFTNYQSKAAKARLQAKLTPLETPEPEPESTEPKAPSLPARETQREENPTFDSYGDWF